MVGGGEGGEVGGGGGGPFALPDCLVFGAVGDDDAGAHHIELVLKSGVHGTGVLAITRTGGWQEMRSADLINRAEGRLKAPVVS